MGRGSWVEQAARFALILVAIILATSGLSLRAEAQERRVALVLGNASYQHTPRLLNPVRDAQSIINRLKELDFEVISGLDMTTAETEALVAKFAKDVRGADVALFYYAGHALQLDGNNYLIPVDAMIEDETALDFEAIQLDLVLRQMARDTKARLVFIDAALANPLADRLLAAGGNATLGLAEPKLAEGGQGAMISMASAPNQVVEEVVGAHSPFTDALLASLGAANATMKDVADRIDKGVSDATGGKQKAWTVSSLATDVMLRAVDMNAPLIVGEEQGAAPADSAAAPATQPTQPGGQDQAALEKLREQIPTLASDSPIFFDIPIQFGDPAIDGKSISMLIQGKPLFSPVEGLEEQVWSNHCSACHQWTKERLCEQAKTYAVTDTAVLRLPHPLGTRFKVALGRWFQNDCQ